MFNVNVVVFVFLSLRYYNHDPGRISKFENKLISGATVFNLLMHTLKLHSNGLLHRNTVIGTLSVDGWAVTFGTARRGLGGLRPRPVPSLLYQM